MKNISKIVVVNIFILMLIGCTNKIGINTNNTQNANNESLKSNKEITVNKLSFEVIKDSDVPEQMENFIKVLKANKGYIFTEHQGNYYIAIFSGKKPTGGYSIKAISAEDNEGKTNIYVEEKSPNQGDIVTQAITNPYTIIKFKKVLSNIIVKNTKGEEFLHLNKESEQF